MIIHLSLLCLVSIICLLPKLNNNIDYKACLKTSFILIWGYTAFRYDYGPDYENYKTLFSNAKLNEINPNVEILYIQFIKIFPKFYMMIIFTSTLLCLSFYYFITSFIGKEYYWIALLFFFIEISLLLNNITAMRSSICVCLFIFSFKYIIKRKLTKYAFLIILASLIHSSAIILLPIYYITYLKITHKNRIILIISCFILMLIGPYISDHIINFSFDKVETLSKYSIYLENKKIRNLNGLIIQVPFILIIFLTSKYYSKEHNFINKILMSCSVIYILIMLLQLDTAGRFSMYFWPVYLATITILAKHISNKALRFMFLVIYVLVSSFGLYNLYNTTYGAYFLEYKSIFEIQVLP